MPRQRRKLTVEERVAIDRRRKDGWGDRAGAWPLAQRDQYGDRARPGTGRQLRRRPGAGGSAAGDAGPGWQPPVCRGGEAAAAGADRREASGGWNGNVVRTPSEAIYQAPCRAVSCGASCSPARASRIVVQGWRGRICDSIRERPAAVEGARTLGGRSDQGQPFLGRHAGPAAS
jgi:hypothetical protein